MSAKFPTAFNQSMIACKTDEVSKSYWESKLSMLENIHSLPHGFQEYADNVQESASLEFSLHEDISLKLAQVCTDSQSLFILLTTVIYIQMLKHHGTDCFSIGIHANPKNDETPTEDCIIPIIVSISERMTFRDVLKLTKTTFIESLEHSHYPVQFLFERVFNKKKTGTPFAITAAFNSVHQHGDTLNGLSQEISFLFNRDGSRVNCILTYNPLLIEDAGFLADTYQLLLKECLAHPDGRLSHLNSFSADDYRKLRYKLNDTHAEYPETLSVNKIFEQQVEKFPHRIALSAGNAYVTYHNLNERANVLARLLMQKGVTTNVVVATLQNTGIEYIISLLAILKAGGVYVSLAPESPVNNLKYSLYDTSALLLLTTKALTQQKEIDLTLLLNSMPVPAGNIRSIENSIIFLDDMDFSAKPVPENPVCDADLAYIMFTSGSTGTPKGVLISHQNVLSLVKSIDFVELSQQTRILLTGAPTFDATTFEIWGALLNGGLLSLPEKEDILDAETLQLQLQKNATNTLWLTAPLFDHFIRDGYAYIFSGLENILIGGDKLTPKYVMEARKQNRKLKIINGYGPTENTTFSLTKEIEKYYKRTIPIGRPISNRTAYVLNEKLDIQPFLTWGSLYVGGDGVAKGYLNNPELTHEKFIADPFSAKGNLYKTEDIARVHPNLDVEFGGRVDGQVKIRGYRIELGQIENHILKIEGVESCLVLVKENSEGDKYLCGYFIGSELIDAISIRLFLIDVLPEYMVPAHLFRLEKFPVNRHGKIDITKLQQSTDVSEANNSLLTDETELKLAIIWSGILGIDKGVISKKSNFFELGGHSLQAMSLLSNIHKTFSVRIPLPTLFKAADIKGLSTIIKTELADKFQPIKIAEKKEYYPLSPAQQRVYIIQQLNPEGIAYNIANAAYLKGSIDLQKIQTCFNTLIERHESLRTAFITTNGWYYQKIEPDVHFRVDYRAAPDSLDTIVRDFIKPFDLTKAPLFRATIIKKDENTHLLLLDIHHIINDGLSQEILLKEFQDLMEDKALPVKDRDYRDITEWQQQAYFKKQLADAEAYWLDEFKGEIPAINLPLDFKRPKIKKYNGGVVKCNLSGKPALAIKRFCNNHKITLHTLLLSLWSITLSKYTNQYEIVIGNPISGRKRLEMASVVGMFVNTLPIRCLPFPSKNLLSYIAEIAMKLLKAQEYQDYPLENLIDKLSVSRTLNRNPLFDVCFNLLESSGDVNEFHKNEEITDRLQQIAKFDIALNVFEFKDSVCLSFEYDNDIFKQDTVNRIAESFIRLSESISEAPDVLLNGMNVLSKKERLFLLETLNRDKLPAAPYQNIGEMFDSAVSNIPDAIAIIDEEGAITYRMLNSMANKLALKLTLEGLHTGDAVGVCMANIKEMAVAMLGILKAGGVFLPFDPELPSERVRQMLGQSDTTIIVCQQNIKIRLENIAKLILIETLNNETSQDTEYQSPVQSPESIAYIIFTSGSTGVPRGVKISHRALMNLCSWHIHYYGIKNHDRTTKYASLSFDATIWEIFPYLCAGASIYFVPNTAKYDVELLNAHMDEQCVTISFLPTQIGEKFSSLRNRTLKKLLVGGDRLKQFNFSNNSYKLYNNYGPTENAVVATAGEIDINTPVLHIGQPIYNANVHILVPDSNDLTPLFIAGELCLTGESLSSGYLDQDINNRSFVPDPFHLGRLMYRTGDLARWLPDGNLEFLGRINDQVKIRGYRIELSEIEHNLVNMEGISEAVVLYDGDRNFFCGYYVARQQLSSHDIKQRLRHLLPAYMVPDFFIQLDEMPLNHSGKVDKKKLIYAFELPANMLVAPEGDLEIMLVRIWAEVLGTTPEKIGVKDNFFDIGGNSILIMQLKEKIKSDLDKDIPVLALFEHTTIQMFIEFIEQGSNLQKEKSLQMLANEQESLSIFDHTLKALNIK